MNQTNVFAYCIRLDNHGTSICAVNWYQPVTLDGYTYLSYAFTINTGLAFDTFLDISPSPWLGYIKSFTDGLSGELLVIASPNKEPLRWEIMERFEIQRVRWFAYEPRALLEIPWKGELFHE